MALLGLGFAGHALWQAARAVTGRQGGTTGRPLDTGHRLVAAATAVIYAGFARTLDVLGMVGFVARGIVVGVAGGFLVDAAVTFDPHKAKGLDGSLRSLARAPGGSVGLLAAAAGLAAFGLWSIAVGVWMDAPT